MYMDFRNHAEQLWKTGVRSQFLLFVLQDGHLKYL